MAILHTAYLFDWEAFRAAALPLAQAVDRSDDALLRARANAVLDHLQRDEREWLLHDPKSNPLLDLGRWPSPLKPDQIGYCFLVLLSSFLRRSPASLLGDWAILHAGLAALGWRENDAVLLTRGLYAEVLLRPGRVADPLLRPTLGGDTSRDDYAWWVRARNGDTGWLDTATVARLLPRLQALQGDLARLDGEQLRRATYPTTGRSASPARLLTGYQHAVAMLTAAAQEDRGVFMTIS